MLTNPIYSGTYAYGRTHRVTQVRDGQLVRVTRRRPDGSDGDLMVVFLGAETPAPHRYAQAGSRVIEDDD